METTATTKREHQSRQQVNPFYSPSTIDDGNEQYKYAQYKVFAIALHPFIFTHPHSQPTFPDVSWEPLKEAKVVDRGPGADSGKKNLLSAASKCITLTPAIGTELRGIDLRQLSDAQKDEL